MLRSRALEWSSGLAVKRKSGDGGEQNQRGQTGDEEIDQRSGNGNADVALPGVDRIGNGVRFVEDGDSADRQQNDALRRNARAARHQRVTQFVQHHAAENNPDQRKPAQRGGRILRGGFRAPHKDQQKQEGQMNADFDSEKTSDRDGPTAHRHACQYSI